MRKNILRSAFLGGIALAATYGVAQADLILTLGGVHGSNVISFVASGSVIMPGPTNTVTGTTARAPIGGTWTFNFDNNLGDVLAFANSDVNDDLVLSSPIDYKRNGATFGSFDTIDLDPGGANDDIELDPTGSITYPVMAANDVLSWDGAGTFTLDSGTFETVFNLGRYSVGIDGGKYTVSVVPVPAALPLFGSALGLIGFAGWRKRKLTAATV